MLLVASSCAMASMSKLELGCHSSAIIQGQRGINLADAALTHLPESFEAIAMTTIKQLLQNDLCLCLLHSLRALSHQVLMGTDGRCLAQGMPAAWQIAALRGGASVPAGVAAIFS